MKRYEIDQVDRLYARVWGDSIHFGLYADDATEFADAVLAAKRAMADGAGLRAGDLVLEVASGWGASARYLADRCGCTVIATNYADRHAAVAQDRCARQIAAGTIRPAMADYHALPFRDAVFDAHWSQESLVHAQDKRRVFAEAYRVLKPGGRIVFTDQTTRRDRLSASARDRIAGRHGSDDLWSEEDFAMALSRAGFQEVRQHDWSVHMARHFAALHERLDAQRAALEREIDPAVLDENRDIWQWGEALARTGGIGYAMFVAVRPPD